MSMLVNDKFAIVNNSNKLSIYTKKSVNLSKSQFKILLSLSDNKSHTFNEISNLLYGINADDYILNIIRSEISDIRKRTGLKIESRKFIGYTLKDKIIIFEDEGENETN